MDSSFPLLPNLLCRPDLGYWHCHSSVKPRLFYPSSLHPFGHHELLVHIANVFILLIITQCLDFYSSFLLVRLPPQGSPFWSPLIVYHLPLQLTWASFMGHSILLIKVCVLITFAPWILAQCLEHSKSPGNLCWMSKWLILHVFFCESNEWEKIGIK